MVRRLIEYDCPVQQKRVTEVECQGCSHHFGDASPREIYCFPKEIKIGKGRQAKDRERRERKRQQDVPIVETPTVKENVKTKK